MNTGQCSNAIAIDFFSSSTRYGIQMRKTTVEQYQLDRIKAHLQIIRYLMINADNKGATHGEKHHFIQVALFELAHVLSDMRDSTAYLTRYDTEADPKDVSVTELPF
jgi:hypothetical protein